MTTKRKKTPPTTEADVLEKSARRCCVCYALQRDFKEKKGQVAHLDHNPANLKLDNLCFLCRDHHDDYDTPRRQSKGLTLIEVKRYRSNLYDTVEVWKESRNALNNLPNSAQALLLNFFEETSPVIKTSTQGTKIVERQAACRVADKEHLPSINLGIQFNEMKIDSRVARILHLQIGTPFGLTFHSEVCVFDDWSITGFMNVLRNHLDIWIMRGQPLRNDKRDPMFQPRDSLVIYRTTDGENRLVISTHAISEAPIQFHASISNKVMDDLANHLDAIGFSRSFRG